MFCDSAGAAAKGPPCKLILRVMTTPAASVWDNDTGGCLKFFHSSVMFSLSFHCVFVPVLGGLQRDLVESDVQNDIANDDNFCSFNFGQ